MKRNVNSKDIQKRVKFLLNSVHISFDLAKALKWRSLYRLLKRAKSLDSRLDISKTELKQLAKDITNSQFSIKEESSITNIFNIKIAKFRKIIQIFILILFIKPFVIPFLDRHPILLI